MTLVYAKYLWIIVAGSLVFLYYFLRIEKSYYEWVKKNWYFFRTKISRVSSILLALGIIGLTFSLLDLRGERQKIKGRTGDQKTILLIDSSLSMLAEDIRPNRFEKAIFVARHFIKNSAGHKISVMIFSDTHKKLVPFTSDRDLLDSRVAALRDIGVSGGGTGIRQAIQESLQYLGKEKTGNIILITDAEETDAGFNLQVPDSVSIAVIGIGTAKGGSIPLRDSSGVSRGLKKHNGEVVISKLDEAIIKKLGDNVKFFRYWIASSYSLPTSEIIDFFLKSITTRVSQNDVEIKPVIAEILLVPALILLILGYLLKIKGPLHLALLIIFFSLSAPSIRAQDVPGKIEEKSDPKKKEQEKIQGEIQGYLDQWSDKEISQREKMDLASKYLRLKEGDKSSLIYQENLGDKINEENKHDYFNWSTSELKKRNFPEAIEKLKKINKYFEQNPSDENKMLQEKVRENTLWAIKEKQSEDEKQQQNNKKNDKQQTSDQKDDSQNNPQDQKDKNEDSSEKKKDQDSDKKDSKDKQDEQKNSSEKKPEDQKDKKGMSGLLKQLLNDDRELQKKMLDTETRKRSTSPKKDW